MDTYKVWPWRTGALLVNEHPSPGSAPPRDHKQQKELYICDNGQDLNLMCLLQDIWPPPHLAHDRRDGRVLVFLRLWGPPDLLGMYQRYEYVSIGVLVWLWFTSFQSEDQVCVSCGSKTSLNLLQTCPPVLAPATCAPACHFCSVCICDAHMIALRAEASPLLPLCHRHNYNYIYISI